MAFPPTLVVFVTVASLSPRHKVAGAADAPLIKDGARVPGSVGPSGTTTQSPVLTLGRPASSSLFGLFLRRGDEEVALGYGDFLKGLEEL